ncbi:Alpha/Beta hydrolase protein [Kockovaella imperatae]|uniref:Alpha/Beta hydrolase protein n=1 Tax=Kockovaella imperatae TaxID=4999 RepID=A0A1Y1URH7_9TREE|nr:Alpha/Beta hydrolase protein [Kockovaella imperatae]ORX40671.1 Alpha/Beta hydrolase protein [Kockovaella imperatae]
MSLFPAHIFQIPLPSLVYLLPPHHPAQWVFRGVLMVYVVVLVIPLVLILSPLSVLLGSLPWRHVNRLTPLAIHPDNLPPKKPILTALGRCIGVYIVSSVAWAITSSGCAPDTSETRTGPVVRGTLNTIEYVCRSETRLAIDEINMDPAPEEACIGVMRMKGIERVSRRGYWLRQQPAKLPDGSGSMGKVHTGSDKHAILFLAGGGYVTGATLSHPFVYSLMRSLPAACLPGGYSLLAPSVRKSLDMSRAFPAPLLDALAGYCHLLKDGYLPENITFMGDSAGGGLCWSLFATLVVLDEETDAGLGVPGKVALISPWLALPPCPSAQYPDFLNKPMMLNAARCYMARFPIVKHRPDPFKSTLPQLSSDISRMGRALGRRVDVCARRSKSSDVEANHMTLSREILRPDDEMLDQSLSSLSRWLEIETFTRMTSHHPLVSPATDPNSPFVTLVFKAMSRLGTKLLIHAGTGEGFYSAAMSFGRAAKAADTKVQIEIEEGGFHSEACIMPGEWGGASQRLVGTLVEWLARLK